MCRVLKFELDKPVEKMGLISMTPAGQIVYANEVVEKMLGYETGKLPIAYEAHSCVHRAVGWLAVICGYHVPYYHLRLALVCAP